MSTNGEWGKMAERRIKVRIAIGWVGLLVCLAQVYSSPPQCLSCSEGCPAQLMRRQEQKPWQAVVKGRDRNLAVCVHWVRVCVCVCWQHNRVQCWRHDFVILFPFVQWMSDASRVRAGPRREEKKLISFRNEQESTPVLPHRSPS